MLLASAANSGSNVIFRLGIGVSQTRNHTQTNATQGEDTGSALRGAKLDLLAKYGEQVSPFYWAAFIAVGEASTPVGIKQ